MATSTLYKCAKFYDGNKLDGVVANIEPNGYPNSMAKCSEFLLIGGIDYLYLINIQTKKLIKSIDYISYSLYELYNKNIAIGFKIKNTKKWSLGEMTIENEDLKEIKKKKEIKDSYSSKILNIHQYLTTLVMNSEEKEIIIWKS